MELKKSLPPPRDFSPMLAQAKYDTPSVRDAGLPRSAGWPAKLRADARIDDLRGCVSLGRVRFAGPRRFLTAILGMGRPQIALWLAAIARFEADRKSTRLNSSHSQISYAVFCLKK